MKFSTNLKAGTIVQNHNEDLARKAGLRVKVQSRPALSACVNRIADGSRRFCSLFAYTVLAVTAGIANGADTHFGYMVEVYTCNIDDAGTDSLITMKLNTTTVNGQS